MAEGALVTVAIAGGASLFMAWTIGAGSSGSTPFAPAVGANAISILRAGLLVGLLGFAGAVMQGANVTETVGRGLVEGATLSPVAAAAAAGWGAAAGLVAVGIFTGYPIATAFTVTGAVIGTGLGLGGTPAIGKYQQIGALWVLTPVVGGGVAYVTARVLRNERVPAIAAVPTLGAAVAAIVANAEFVFLGPAGRGGSIAASGATALGVGPGVGRPLVTAVVAAAGATAVAVELRRDPARGQRRFLLVLGGLVAFSAGGSQVGLAIGPLLPLLDAGALPVVVPTVAILTFGGLGLLAGSWTGAPRMIKALAQDYSSLGPRRSIAALVPSFAIAQTAVFFGIPVSFNEIIVSAIVGSGASAADEDGGGVDRRKMAYTVAAWVGSLVVAATLGYGAALVVRAVG